MTNIFKRLIFSVIVVILTLKCMIFFMPAFLIGIFVKPLTWILTGKSLNDDYWIFGPITLYLKEMDMLDKFFKFN